MFKKFLQNGSQILTRRQTNILSAAGVIMMMVAVSRVLGLVRNRVLAHFFTAEVLAVYFAAFRLPEVIFEVLVFGSLSSAFIPIFTAYISRRKRKQAWYVAAVSLNFALLVFVFFALIIFSFARPLYQLLAPGFSAQQLDQTAYLTRWLLLAQGFFVLSYWLTGVLESLQRFLVPALAPLFYNLGIILGTFFWAESRGVGAPTLGAVAGAFSHFLIQLPLAIKLGFKPRLKLDFHHSGVREIGRLALPRIIELSALQISKGAELFFASLVTPAAYAYFTLANSLQLLPVGLFGASLAKASLPTLARLTARGQKTRFQETLASSFNEIVFLVVPFSVFLAVLRLPVVRLVFGAAQFDWESTVQTSHTLSAFCLGILAQALVYLLTRAFWALHDTRTPVLVSLLSIFLNIGLSAFFVLVLHGPIWTLAFSYSFSVLTQTLFLLLLLVKKHGGLQINQVAKSFVKVFAASFFSGGLMYFGLKILDRSVWDKRLSFLGRWGLILPTTFDRLLLDTRYTVNLLFLTILVAFIGVISFLLVAWLLRVKELALFSRIFTKLRGFRLSVSAEEDLSP